MEKADIAHDDNKDVYVFVSSIDRAWNNTNRFEWVKLDIKLKEDEVIEKIAYRGEKKGGNNITFRREDMNRLTARLMNLCEALFTDKEQKEAWKKLLKTAVYEVHDEKFSRYNL